MRLSILLKNEIRNMKKLILSVFVGLLSWTVNAQNFTPTTYLGYEIGTRFTRQDKVVSYFHALQAAYPSMMKVEKYGETYEHRDLILAFFGTPENLKKLEEIRQNHQKHAASEKLAIVWLSYNVHGNESSGTEAAMQTAYRLLTDKVDYLSNTIVIMDPCLNPDGRDRYVNFYQQYGNAPADLHKFSAEHKEPWPSGRPNHYLFDLNRDWAWMTQIESEQRVQRYNQWLPHVHVDFHEQGINEPYYFPPAAEPYHEVITNWQRDFQKQIGANHASYFDKEGWLYFSKEIFDLLYPSYGDTYPTYSGSIGMTYEQGGSGRAGLAVITQVGDTLSLKDRVSHHVTTGLSTVEMSSKNADKLIKEYQMFCTLKVYRYKTYVLRSTQAKLEPLMALMKKNGIQVEMITTSTQESASKAYHFQNGQMETIKLMQGDMLIQTNQEKGTLVNVLFEPKTHLSDSLTYDITAWTLPFAYGVEAWAIETTGAKGTVFSGWPTTLSQTPTANCYAYAAAWESMKSTRFLTELQEAGIDVYFNEKGFKSQGISYNPGTLLILRGENKRADFDQTVLKIANKNAVSLNALASGFVQEGIDLGSSSVKKIPNHSIGLLAGEDASSLNVGEIWHFFERQMGRSIHLVFTDDLEEALPKLTVLFVPEGGISLSENAKVKEWIQNGGKLIVLGYAIYDFAGKDGFELSSSENKNDSIKKPVSFSKQERDQISNAITGAIFECEFDATNPLAYGYDRYYTLRQGADHLNIQSSNVFHLKKDAKALNGFVGARVKQQQSEASIAGFQSYGNGAIIYFIDNPLFRGFWENGKLMVANAVFFVNEN
jgi:hypothetical protein